MSAPNEFQVGVAWRDISPPQPQLLRPTGMGRLVSTRGVLDGLRVEAMAIRAGGELAFVTTSDLRVIYRPTMREIRDAVARKTGCDPKKILFSAVHNHCSSPAAADDSPAAKAALEEADRKIIDGFIDSCVEAAGRLAPAEIAAAAVQLTEPVGQCRRSRLSSGIVVNCWGSGPVIPPGRKYAGQAGPDSTRVDILAARRPGEPAPFAVLTSYASHPHLYGLPYFSGEFPGALKRRIEAAIPGAVSLHANHAGGNVDLHCVHPIPDGDENRLRWFRDSAALLAERVARAVLPAVPTDGFFRPRELRHVCHCSGPLEGPKDPPLTLINAIGLDDVALVSVPCELFLEFGLRIHEASPFRHTILMAYDGSWGEYIPPALAFEQGGYEVSHGPRLPEEEEKVLKTGRIVLPETGEQITATVLEVLGALRDCAPQTGSTPSRA